MEYLIQNKKKAFVSKFQLCIGGLFYQITSSCPVAHLHDRYRDSFEPTTFIEHPDVQINIMHTNPLDVKTDQNCDYLCKWLSNNGLILNAQESCPSNELLGNQNVQQILLSLINHPRPFHISYQKDLIIIRDYHSMVLHLFCTKNWGPFGHEIQINSYLRSIFSSFQVFFNRFLLHSSAVINQKKAFIFIGPDSAGKTTAAKISSPRKILNEDQIIIEQNQKEFFAHSTPFASVFSSPARYRTAAIIHVKQSDHFAIQAISPPELLQCLIHDHKKYLYYLPVDARKKAFNMLADFCFTVPTFEMSFTKDFIDWNEIERQIG